MRILWRSTLKLHWIPSCGRAHAKRSESNPRAAPSGPAAGIFHRPAFWFDFRKSSATLYFHDLVTQQGRALEFEVRRGLLHLLLQFSQQFGYIEIATSLLNHRCGDFASAKNGVQTLLHGASDRLRRDAMLLVVFHLFRAPVFRNRYQCFHALSHLISEEHYFTVHVARGPTSGLNERSLAAQKTFLVCIQNAHKRNFGKIETFAKQIDANENIEIGCAQSAQDFDSLNGVN